MCLSCYQTVKRVLHVASGRCICAQLSRQVLGVLSNNMIFFDIVHLSELISQMDNLQSRTVRRLAFFQPLFDMAVNDSAFFALLYRLSKVLSEFAIALWVF
jgi:hypothetical protein